MNQPISMWNKKCNTKIVQKKLQKVPASFFKTCKVIKLETTREVESECMRNLLLITLESVE